MPTNPDQARMPRFGAHSLGIAMISAMMVIAIVSASSTWLVRSQIINLQRSERVMNAERAFVAALGVEDMVRELLLQDLRLDAGDDKREDYYVRRFDRNGDGFNDVQLEKWSLPFSFSDTPVKGAQLRWCVHDLGGFIDLNKLASSDQQTRNYTRRVILALIEILFRKKEEESFFLQTDSPDEAADDEDVQALEELIVSHGIDVDTFALESANALADWFDGDNNVREPGGAERDDYLFAERNPPYLPANGILMAWTDEIRLVKGYHESNAYLAEAVLPYVAAVPVKHAADKENKFRLSINLNTAPREVVKAVLRSRGRPSDELIDEVFDDKMHPPYPILAPVYYRFDSVGDFCSRIGLLSDDGGRKTCGVLENYFFVTSSRFFQLDLELTMGDTGSWFMQSLFYRHGVGDASQKDVFVLQRSVGSGSHYRKTDLNRWRRCQ